jgi:hypothetical protein
MSIKVLNLVWGKSSQRGAGLLVLLAIADYANQEGLAWPSVPTLSSKARLTIRHTQRVLRKLVKMGELEIQKGQGPHGTNYYRVTLGPVAEKSGLTFATLMGDIRGLTRVALVSPNPSEEIVKESFEVLPPIASDKKSKSYVPMPQDFRERMKRVRLDENNSR